MSESAREFTRRAFSNWIERRKRIMGEDDVAEVAQDMQSCTNVAHYPPMGSLTPYGWALDQAGQEALKEHARVQQSVLVLQQAAAIRADKTLMESIRKHLRGEKARISSLMDEIG